MTFDVFTEKNLTSWDDFLIELRGVQTFRDARDNDPNSLFVSKLLYRGQGRKDWALSTTLERTTRKDSFRVIDYYQIISKIAHELESFTSEQWQLPDPHTYISKRMVDIPITMGSTWLFAGDNDLCTYYVYLRHHGFPSPLLDWTRSPYIAAFFAFQEERTDVEFVTIYIFLDHAGFGQSTLVADPMISLLGPNIRSHKRHYLQQCEYTFCLNQEKEESSFISHKHGLEVGREDQQYIWKYNIPYSERTHVLKYLNSVNINSFSLFQTNEELMNTLAIREFGLEK